MTVAPNSSNTILSIISRNQVTPLGATIFRLASKIAIHWGSVLRLFKAGNDENGFAQIENIDL